MSRRCGASKPTPTPLNDLAMKPGKARRKVIEGNADTLVKQTTVKNLPRTVTVAGGARRERRYDMANHCKEKLPRTASVAGGGRGVEGRNEGERRPYDKGNQRQNPPVGYHRGGGRDEKARHPRFSIRTHARQLPLHPVCTPCSPVSR